MIHLIAQTTQPIPVIFDPAKIKIGLSGGIIGAALAFYHDLQKYQDASANAAWNWKATTARVSTGFVGGFLGGMGIGNAIGW